MTSACTGSCARNAVSGESYERYLIAGASEADRLRDAAEGSRREMKALSKLDAMDG
jgi:hypothetical protein